MLKKSIQVLNIERSTTTSKKYPKTRDTFTMLSNLVVTTMREIVNKNQLIYRTYLRLPTAPIFRH